MLIIMPGGLQRTRNWAKLPSSQVLIMTCLHLAFHYLKVASNVMVRHYFTFAHDEYLSPYKTGLCLSQRDQGIYKYRPHSLVLAFYHTLLSFYTQLNISSAPTISATSQLASSLPTSVLDKQSHCASSSPSGLDESAANHLASSERHSRHTFELLSSSHSV